MKRLNADLKNQTFARAYLLYGNEEYLKLQYRNKLQSALTGGDEMNLLLASGKDLSVDRLKDFTDTMPFFAERRVVVLSETGLMKGSSEGFSEWIRTLPDTACVIFVENETDKRNRVFKAVSEVGYAAELNHPDHEMMEKWVLGTVRQQGLNITRDAFTRILEATGPDMDNIRNELLKVCDYCREKGSIELTDVNEIIVPVMTSRIFEMIEAVSKGDRKKALDLYYDLLALKEPPMRILFLIARQFNQLMVTAEMTRERKGQNDIAAALSVKPFIAGKLISQARAFSTNELKTAIALCVDFEYAVKTGDLNETMAVELLILQFTDRNSRRKG